MKKKEIPNILIEGGSTKVNFQIESKGFKLKCLKRCRKGVRIELRSSGLSGALVGILKG